MFSAMGLFSIPTYKEFIMSDALLRGVAEDLKNADTAITEAQKLIDAMKEAGETVTAQEAEIRSLRIRKDKWQRMLEARGIKATE